MNYLSKSTETENKLVIASNWGKGGTRIDCKQHGISFYNDENILELENLQCSEIKQRSVQGALTTVLLPGMLVEEDLEWYKK